jgi:hypothetical protein
LTIVSSGPGVAYDDPSPVPFGLANLLNCPAGVATTVRAPAGNDVDAVAVVSCTTVFVAVSTDAVAVGSVVVAVGVVSTGSTAVVVSVGVVSTGSTAVVVSVGVVSTGSTAVVVSVGVVSTGSTAVVVSVGVVSTGSTAVVVAVEDVVACDHVLPFGRLFNHFLLAICSVFAPVDPADVEPTSASSAPPQAYSRPLIASSKAIDWVEEVLNFTFAPFR